MFKINPDPASFLGRAFAKARDLHGRWQRYTAEVKQAQLDFNATLERVADVAGVTNLERLLDGKPPVEEVNVWAEMGARRPAPAPEAPPSRYNKPFPGSAREAQLKFNEACERYADKHGIVALEQALKPAPTPVPVSDPEPKPIASRKKYIYP